MAFNRPIDADRVDDLGLLSSILRAPIIGPVFWVIKKLTKQQQEELDSVVCRTVPRESFATAIDESISSQDNHSSESLPSMITDRLDILSDETQRNLLQQADLFKHDLPPPLKKTRKTSWSDQSGHLLVNYCNDETDQSSSSGFIRTLPALLPPNKPMKSAMRRTPGRTSIDASQYIPPGESSTGQREVGFSLPGGDDCYNGYVSPQWGWYATGSTTPPTPEQFYSTLPPKNTVSSNVLSDAVNVKRTDDPAEDIQKQMQKIDLIERPKPSVNNSSRMKPVLKKGMPRDSSGWPSVPL